MPCMTTEQSLLKLAEYVSELKNEITKLKLSVSLLEVLAGIQVYGADRVELAAFLQRLRQAKQESVPDEQVTALVFRALKFSPPGKS
jgi:hypothetical protein